MKGYMYSNNQSVSSVSSVSGPCNSFCISGHVVAVFLAIVAGVVAGLLFANEMIPNITTVVEIALVLAGISLILLVWGLFTAAVPACQRGRLAACLCCNSTFLLTGIIGTIVASVLALAIELIPGAIAAAVLVGFVAFFFTILLAGLILLIQCLAEGLCAESNWEQAQ